MPSPFPGMDPYLEGYLWADVHQALAGQIRKQLAPQVEPTYAVRLAVYMENDLVPASELGVVYPAVEVVRPPQPAPRTLREGLIQTAAIAPAPVFMPLAMPLPVRLVNVEIRDVARNRLVTAIEILSPANKRGPGLDNYRVKRDRLRQAGVHVLEIDLLRRGVRLWPAEYLPDSPYLAVLLRAGNQRAEVWLIGLRENLPVLPVPLRYPDPDTPLDLQAALSVIYDEARYDLTLSYEAPPPPPSLAQADALWALQCVQVWAGRVVSFRQPPSPVAPPAT